MRPDQPEADEPDRPPPGRDRVAPASADRGAPPGDGAETPARPPSRAEQLAEHARLRDSVAARDEAAASRDAWSEASPRLRAAWEQHRERYPDRAQAAPRTETDGSWSSGERRRLDPEQNTEAGKAHADLADEASRHILPALRRVEAADPDRRLAGLEHMVKGEDRLKEKIADVWHGRPGLSSREVFSLIPDAVRFTLTYTSERYTAGVLTDIGRLKAEGFELLKLKNLWTAEQYKGVNSQWLRPESGIRIEVQFHTPESLDAKELTHEAYERIRANTVLPVDQQDLSEEDDLEIFQRRVNALVEVPPGTDRIKDFPEKRNV